MIKPESITTRLQSMRAYKPSPSAEKKILILSMLVLATGIYLSLRAHPNLLSRIDWLTVALVMLIGVPVTALINALEFIVSANMAGVNFPLVRAIKITIIGSAANMLPLPGAAMVRIVALKASGVSFGKGTGITLLLSLIWVGVSFLYAGVMLLQYDTALFTWLLGASGAAILLGSLWLTGYSGARKTDYLRIVILKLAMVLVDAVRIYFCFRALSLDVHFSQASAFVVSSVLGSAVSFVPAGLGVRELVSAGVAPLVGVAVSAGFLTTTLNRIAGLLALLPLAGLLVWLDKQTAADKA